MKRVAAWFRGRHLPLGVVIAVVLVLGSTGLLVYLAYAAQRTGAVVATLPCDASLITDTCMAEATVAFDREGVTGFAETVYRPVLGLVLFATTMALATAWILASAHRGRWMLPLGALTAVAVVAVGVLIQHWDALEVSSWVVE